MHCCRFVVLLLLCQILSSHEDPEVLCPIGFQLAYSKKSESPEVCHRLKGPEAFEDVYEDCVGNMFSVKLYRDLDIEATDHQIWTEYRSLYPGGPFVDVSHSDRYGHELDANLTTNHNISLDEEWCTVLDPRTNFTIVKCSEKRHRYCFVEPYSDNVETSDESCEGLEGSLRFRSPVSTCVAALAGARGTSMRATWSQARSLCADRNSSLLYRGWIYANRIYANTSKSKDNVLPLGVKMRDDAVLYDALNDNSKIPSSKWHFLENRSMSDEQSLGAQNQSGWFVVDSSYVFYNVACERAVPLKHLVMQLTIDYDKKTMKLTVNDTIDQSDVLCYTDSVKHYPIRVSKGREKFSYGLRQNGYYWCTHKDLKNFAQSVSNKILYIEKPESAKNVFAIKIYLPELYTLSGFYKIFYKSWAPKLKEYLYYKYQYESMYGPLSETGEERALMQFMKKNLATNLGDVPFNAYVKRYYLDQRTVLLHARLSPGHMGRVSPGTWFGLRIASVKPVYFCTVEGTEIPLGGSVNTSDCKTFSCVGEFTEGVSSVETRTEDCVVDTPQPTTTVATTTRGNMPAIDIRKGSGESSEESTELTPHVPAPTTHKEPDPELMVETTAPSTIITVPPTIITVPPRPPRPTTLPTPTVAPPVTTDVPTTTEIPRGQQIEDVMQALEDFVNQTNVTVEAIDGVFGQVDEILTEHDDDVEIPGRLLHLLEHLASTVVLNETGLGQAVRPNIALLMADAQPHNPVRGFRISTVNETFHDHDFEFILEEPNSTILNADESEVVVNLPASVSAVQRRVSFVVFRNDRAFHSDGYAVNSRVLSVNVENVTHFHGGEAIDIHLSPIVTELARNKSRSCAYWHFLENGTGYWSQEGCTFIRATEDGILDTCRCNHLTHFAEVLAPKAVFSEADESALEVISIVGCILSMLGLVLIGVTALLFRSWRREYSNKIWLQLCMAIFVLVLSFLLVIFLHFDQYDASCLLVGVLLHYSVLASFCWMLVAAVLAYRRLVLVFSRDTSHKLLKASAFSWGAPCVVVGVLLSVSRDSYGRTFEEMTPSGAFCYPTGMSFWLTVYAPLSIVLLTNWILFALIVRSVFVSRRIERHGETNEALRCASVSCMLVFLFGLPWIFGLFASNVVAAYLFTLTATFQGFVLFLFFVIGNKKTRDLWLNKLHIKQTRKVPVTSSTYTNRSAEWRAAHVPATIAAKVSKPKVLASKDETRFS